MDTIMDTIKDRSEYEIIETLLDLAGGERTDRAWEIAGLWGRHGAAREAERDRLLSLAAATQRRRKDRKDRKDRAAGSERERLRRDWIAAQDTLAQANWPARTARGRGDHQIGAFAIREKSIAPHTHNSVDVRWPRSGEKKRYRHQVWRVRDHAHTIGLPRAYTLRIISGVLTAAHALRPADHPAYWYRPGRGCSIEQIAGWLIRGIHVPGADRNRAEKKAKRMQRDRVRSRLEARERQRADRRALADRIAAALGRDPLRLIRMEDSRQAGNCAAGTEAWLTRRGRPGATSIPAACLAAMIEVCGDDQPERALRVLEQSA